MRTLAAAIPFLLLCILQGGCRSGVTRDTGAPAAEWPSYGNNPENSRYSPLTEITPATVGHLKVAWIYHTGDVSDGKGTWHGERVRTPSTFEATPLVIEGTMYLVTPFNRIIAIDPETGAEKWQFDPQIDRL